MICHDTCVNAHLCMFMWACACMCMCMYLRVLLCVYVCVYVCICTHKVVVAFEESIGFCCGDLVNDKDGVCAAAVFAEMAVQVFVVCVCVCVCERERVYVCVLI